MESTNNFALLKLPDTFRIAVMLNGHPKHLETTQHLFKHWNNLFNDVHFDFFISIWETVDNQYESFGNILNKEDLNWATKVEFLKEEDCPYDLSKHTPSEHQPHYTYTFKKVNELRNSHNEKYDAVLQTRCDFVMLYKTLYNLVKVLKGGENKNKLPKPQVSIKNIFSENGSSIHSSLRQDGLWQQSLWTHHSWFFGNPKVFDIFSNMFDDMYINKSYKGIPLMHIFQAEYLQSKGIYNQRILDKSTSLLIREPYRFQNINKTELLHQSKTHIVKSIPSDGHHQWSKMHPSSKQLSRLIEDKGLDWIFGINNEKQILEYFETTPKE